MTRTDEGDRHDVAAPGRRALLGAGLAAGLLALTGSNIARAQVGGDDALLEYAMRLELTARDLYDAAVEAGGLEDLGQVLRNQHEAYAQSLSRVTGLSARGRLDDVYDALVGSFAVSDDTAVATAGKELESIAVATHTELVGLLESADAAALAASILVIEARHATVLADAAGLGDDLDALLVNDAEPLLPAGTEDPS